MPPKTVAAFIDKWEKSNLKESSAAQEHFIDLCHLLEHQTPAEADPDGDWFTFEYGAQKTTGAPGFADVWKKGHFGWEYKGKHKDLQAAYAQLQQYAPALANPPLLIVCDTSRFIIHTNWNDFVSEVHEISLEDLLVPEKLNLLRQAFHNPSSLKPTKSRQQLTEEVAGKFASISQELRVRGHEANRVAHFVNRLIFCMFAEDIELLPKGIFTNLLERECNHPAALERKLSSLFASMREGGAWGAEDILWFNGGLFDDDSALELTPDEARMVYETARKDWSDIDPSIMGTLFERGLDPKKQSQLGAHYTNREMIMKIINPVIVLPLLDEWQGVKSKISSELEKAATYTETTKQGAAQKTKAENRAKKAFNAFRVRLKSFTVLDPACGSGNFLYLALKALKDIEQEVNIFGEMTFRLPQSIPEIGPQNLYGIEISPYAAELAGVSIWIGEIQWIRKHGYTVPDNPVLRRLENIQCHDALMDFSKAEYQWPDVSVIVGNPPFIGQRFMLRELGEEYVSSLRKLYSDYVTGNADLVGYWFVKVNKHFANFKLERAGLVSTNSIRYGDNRKVLQGILNNADIYCAWSDEGWINEGASVTVALTCVERKGGGTSVVLNGTTVPFIGASLASSSSQELDLTNARKLPENKGVAFAGYQTNGPFDINGDLAREWLILPSNPNGLKNSKVLRPIINATDVTRRYRDKWVIDFDGMDEAEASLFEAPFEYAKTHVKPVREAKREEYLRKKWWLHKRTSPAMRKSISSLRRFIATPQVSKWRIFRWLELPLIPENTCIVIARDDDVTFGILQGRAHELWTLEQCSFMGKGNDPRYTPSTTFETFPFPESMQLSYPPVDLDKNPKAKNLANAARKLNELRENWLNPTDCIELEHEVVAGYPDRIRPVDEAAHKLLAKRTLTNLYNEMPTWLMVVHKELNDAIALAYGWPTDITDDEILESLFELNLQRTCIGD